MNLHELRTLDKDDVLKEIDEFALLDEVSRKHRSLVEKGILKDILKLYILENEPIHVIANKYNISTSVIHRLLEHFYLFYFDDNKLAELSFIEPSSHLGILYSFFTAITSLTKEIVFNAVFSKKIREELARALAEDGLIKTLENRKLMLAWKENIRRNEILLKLSVDQMNTYLNLIEKVLDKQRELAFVRAVYETLAELDPETAARLYDKLMQDDYARALVETNSVEEFINFIINSSAKRAKQFEIVKNEEPVLDLDVVIEESDETAK